MPPRSRSAGVRDPRSSHQPDRGPTWSPRRPGRHSHHPRRPRRGETAFPRCSSPSGAGPGRRPGGAGPAARAVRSADPCSVASRLPCSSSDRSVATPARCRARVGGRSGRTRASAVRDQAAYRRVPPAGDRYRTDDHRQRRRARDPSQRPSPSPSPSPATADPTTWPRPAGAERPQPAAGHRQATLEQVHAPDRGPPWWDDRAASTRSLGEHGVGHATDAVRVALRRVDLDADERVTQLLAETVEPFAGGQPVAAEAEAEHAQVVLIGAPLPSPLARSACGDTLRSRLRVSSSAKGSDGWESTGASTTGVDHHGQREGRRSDTCPPRRPPARRSTSCSWRASARAQTVAGDGLLRAQVVNSLDTHAHAMV